MVTLEKDKTIVDIYYILGHIGVYGVEECPGNVIINLNGILDDSTVFYMYKNGNIERIDFSLYSPEDKFELISDTIKIVY